MIRAILVGPIEFLLTLLTISESALWRKGGKHILSGLWLLAAPGFFITTALIARVYDAKQIAICTAVLHVSCSLVWKIYRSVPGFPEFPLYVLSGTWLAFFLKLISDLGFR